MAFITELKALNKVLAASGQRRVTSVDSLHPAAIEAKDVLDSINLDVQAGRWEFNTEVRTLVQNTQGEIIIPQDTLFIDPIDTAQRYVQRGGRLYDVEGTTFNIGRSVKVVITVLLAIEDLPYHAANLIQHKAALKFHKDKDGDPQKTIDLEKDVAEAMVAFEREMLSLQDVNAFRSPFAQKLISGTVQTSSGRNPYYPGG